MGNQKVVIVNGKPVIFKIPQKEGVIPATQQTTQVEAQTPQVAQNLPIPANSKAQPAVEKATDIEHSFKKGSPEHIEHLKRVGFQKGQSGNPAGKPPGTKDYKTLFKQVLGELRTKDGKAITEEDFVKAGLVPILDKMMSSQSPRYHRLYIAVMEMVYGKASQNIDVTTQGEKIVPQITGVRIVKEE